MAPPTTPYQPYAAQHEDIEGPGDHRFTALQIVEDADAANKFRGRVAVITGCSSGLGIETVRALYEAGFTLFLTARNLTKLEEVIDDIVTNSSAFKDTDDKPPRPSVRDGAKEILQQTDTLHLLINNAGIMGSPYSTTQDGLEVQLGTNHFAHFLLFRELQAALLKGAKPGSPSRVINLSSDAHFLGGMRFDDFDFSAGKDYDKWKAYGQSKTANIYMANSIQRHFSPQGLIGPSLHSGVIRTGLGKHLDQDDYGMLEGMGVYKTAKSVGQGAATTVWAAISEHFDDMENGGRYLSDIGEAARYAPWAYDEEAEEKLWKVSVDVVEDSSKG